MNLAPVIDLPECLVALDTLGVQDNAVILGIVALRTDLERPGEIATFMQEICLESNLKAGRAIEPNTLRWHLDSENSDLSQWLERPSVTLEEGLDGLADFYAGAERLWSTSGGFESAILANAYRTTGRQTPWEPWHVMCMRTLSSISSWLDHEAIDPLAFGADLQMTAELRLTQLKQYYNALQAHAHPAKKVAA